MGIYVDRKKYKNGTVHFRFTYTDENGKRKRIPADKAPRFQTYEEALAWSKTQAAHQEAMRTKVLQRLAWKEKYYQFDELLLKYLDWQKKRAPNSWQSTRYYLEQHVFNFFLNVKNANNVNSWTLYFQEFRDYLEDSAKSSKGKKSKLSYSTANHIIRTLNTFLEFLKQYNLMDIDSFRTCPCFAQHLVGKRNIDDVITPEEFKRVTAALREKNDEVADFFHVLYHTGLRFNEGFGLPMLYLYGGKLEGPLAEEIQKHNLECYGYIVLESQPKDKMRPRKKDGSVDRKPLKTKKKISPKDSRTIPILDKETWNILARRFKKQKALLEKETHGTNKLNYLLFEDLDLNTATRTLRQTYIDLKLPPKSYHCCRHSCATYLVGKTRSFFLARAMLGHKSDVFEDYLHIFDMIALRAKQNSQEIEEI